MRAKKRVKNKKETRVIERNVDCNIEGNRLQNIL